MTSESACSFSQKARDPGWNYCYLKNPNDKNAVSCNFCHKESKGGIYRFKQHLIGGFRNVVGCQKVPSAVREEMISFMKNSEKKAGRKVFKSNVDHSYNSEDEVEHQKVVCLGSGNSHAKPSTTKQPRIFGPMDSYMNTKRPRIFGPMDSYMNKKEARKNTNMNQTTISAQPKMDERDGVVQSIARFIYQAGIPFSSVKLKSFRDMIEQIGQFGPGLKPPSYHELRGPLLKKEVDLTKDYVEKHKAGWKEYGCTIMVDELKDKQNGTLVNFMVNCPMGTVFLESVDASAYEKSKSKLCELFENIFEKVGVENIVQVVINNGSNFVFAKKLLEAKYHHIFWTPCAAHCLDLMLVDMAKEIPAVRTTINKTMELNGFIYNHARVLNMLRKFTKTRKLVRHAVTRFAKPFLTLQSTYNHKKELRMMFTSEDWVKSKWTTDPKGRKACDIALNSSFWNDVLYVVELSAPLVKVLRLVDNDEKPTMGYIYKAIVKAKEAIKNSMDGDEKKYDKVWNIIDRGWKELSNPLHMAAYFLNPSYYYSDPQIEKDAGVYKGLLTCIEKLTRSPVEQDRLLSELDDYRIASGMLGYDLVIRQRTKRQPARWWGSFGLGVPNLRKLAVRILSLTCSSSSSECNWSVFKNIHNKKKNMQEAKRLNDLVFVHYNQHLRDLFQSRGKFDPICLDNIDYCDEWIANAAHENLVFEDEDLTWIDATEATGLNIDSRPNMRSRCSRGKEPIVEEKEMSEAEETDGDGEEYDDAYNSDDSTDNEDAMDFIDEGEGLFS